MAESEKTMLVIIFLSVVVWLALPAKAHASCEMVGTGRTAASPGVGCAIGGILDRMLNGRQERRAQRVSQVYEDAFNEAHSQSVRTTCRTSLDGKTVTCTTRGTTTSSSPPVRTVCRRSLDGKSASCTTR